MIPYYEQFQWPAEPIFGRLAIRGFSLMVVISILIGYRVLQRRARFRKLDYEDVSDFVFFTVVSGFVGSHVFDVVFYYPEKLAQDPWILFKVWDGISSYGGIISGLIAAWVFFKVRPHLKPRLWDFFDCLSYAWPFAFWIARTGCFLAHDHPGTHTDFFLGVQFPGGARHDLGLYDALYVLLVIVPTFTLLNHAKPDRVRGFYLGLFMLLYAPARFSFDFLRVADKTYAGLTPAQYVSFIAVAFGLYVLIVQPGASTVDPSPQSGATKKGKGKGKGQKKKS